MSFRTLHDRGVIARYRQYLPVTESTPVISLNEGSTPLIHSPKLSTKVGRGCEVFIKYEGLNPTGSFKDRGMTVALSKAVEQGARAVICASTGNTSAAAAAYAARASISCIVLLPAGKIAFGKLAQAFMYGAKVVAIEGNFDDALRLVREIGETEPIAVVNSINPDRLQGQKTASFEVIEELGDSPPTGLVTKSFICSKKARANRSCLAFRPLDQRRFSIIASLSTPRPWQPPSGSVTRRVGTRQTPPFATAMGPLILSPMRKSWLPSTGSPRMKASLSSPPVLQALQAC
jgi:hypothetical protein